MDNLDRGPSGRNTKKKHGGKKKKGTPALSLNRYALFDRGQQQKKGEEEQQKKRRGGRGKQQGNLPGQSLTRHLKKDGDWRRRIPCQPSAVHRKDLGRGTACGCGRAGRMLRREELKKQGGKGMPSALPGVESSEGQKKNQERPKKKKGRGEKREGKFKNAARQTQPDV